MEARYGNACSPREVGPWKSQVRRGRESRKAQGTPRRGSGDSSRRQTSYSVVLALFAEARESMKVTEVRDRKSFGFLGEEGLGVFSALLEKSDRCGYSKKSAFFAM